MSHIIYMNIDRNLKVDMFIPWQFQDRHKAVQNIAFDLRKQGNKTRVGVGLEDFNLRIKSKNGDYELRNIELPNHLPYFSFRKKPPFDMNKSPNIAKGRSSYWKDHPEQGLTQTESQSRKHNLSPESRVEQSAKKTHEEDTDSNTSSSSEGDGD